MIRNLTAAAAVVVLALAWAGASSAVSTASAQVPAKPATPGVAFSGLIGLDPAAVRARLTNVAANWPIPPAFQIAAPDGVLTFVTASELFTDPVLAQRMAAFRTHGDFLPPAKYLECRESLTRDDATPEPNGAILLVFRNNHLKSVFNLVVPAITPPPTPLSPEEWRVRLRQPRTSVFLAHPGDLPLEDGLGFVSRLPKHLVAPTDKLSVTCSPPPPLHLPQQSVHTGLLNAGDLQGLALLPFAAELPSMNRQRVAARQKGAALLKALHVGEMLTPTPEKFAAGHTGVRFYPAKSRDYAVLSIDMGGYPGRNLSNFNDAALVGVRNGRVEWISPSFSFGFGPAAALLCWDEHGVPNAPRPGCKGEGIFTP